jgi:hypothetical protein
MCPARPPSDLYRPFAKFASIDDRPMVLLVFPDRKATTQADSRSKASTPESSPMVSPAHALHWFQAPSTGLFSIHPHTPIYTVHRRRTVVLRESHAVFVRSRLLRSARDLFFVRRHQRRWSYRNQYRRRIRCDRLQLCIEPRYPPRSAYSATQTNTAAPSLSLLSPAAHLHPYSGGAYSQGIAPVPSPYPFPYEHVRRAAAFGPTPSIPLSTPSPGHDLMNQMLVIKVQLADQRRAYALNSIHAAPDGDAVPA